MSLHLATVAWRCEGDFAARRYSRGHTLEFEGGLRVPGTAAPANVNPRYALEGAVDPEQAFTAALAACHMLWFLDLASRAGFSVASYRDEAHGELGEDAAGVRMMTRVVLKPHVSWAGEQRPTDEQAAALHHQAHEACFIANSVRSQVVIEPRPADAEAVRSTP